MTVKVPTEAEEAGMKESWISGVRVEKQGDLLGWRLKSGMNSCSSTGSSYPLEGSREEACPVRRHLALGQQQTVLKFKQHKNSLLTFYSIVQVSKKSSSSHTKVHTWTFLKFWSRHLGSRNLKAGQKQKEWDSPGAKTGLLEVLKTFRNPSWNPSPSRKRKQLKTTLNLVIEGQTWPVRWPSPLPKSLILNKLQLQHHLQTLHHFKVRINARRKTMLKHQSNIQRWAAHLWQVHMSGGQCGAAAARCCFSCFGLCWKTDGLRVILVFFFSLRHKWTSV